MSDQTIHVRSIARHFQPKDFIADPLLLDEAVKNGVVDKAVAIGIEGFAAVSLLKSDLRGKEVYQVTDIAQLLVLRHIAKSNALRAVGCIPAGMHHGQVIPQIAHVGP